MQVAILTDTNSGIPVSAGSALGIHVIPMPVIIEDQSYLEGVDITHAQLYDAMRQHKNVSTSQPSPGVLLDTWNRLLKSGYDQIVYIPMSSGLSTSCSTASQLALDFHGNVQVVDNHRISVTLMESVYDARQYVAQGASAKEIREKLEAQAYECSIYITVNSLEYLKKGGRITPSAAALATVINIKPVLTIQGDKLDSYAKVRGMKQSEKKMIEALKQDIKTRFLDVPPQKLQIATAGTFEHEEDAENWRQTVQNAFPDSEVYYRPLSCSIACHVGVDSAGIGCIRIRR